MSIPPASGSLSHPSERIERFARRYRFPLDSFQYQACASLENGKSVLVAAPTGAGKTVVGEFAVDIALSMGRKVFYTTPIKALSNQKYAELVSWLGEGRVGLLTGDMSHHGDAEVVVMTTEVLRNMLYANSPTLAGLGFVVMDEVHYLADRLRGPVWEEVILHLEASVQLVALSATVSNAEEFGAWLHEVRGDTDVIVSETRPTPLWQHLVVGHDLMDLFVDRHGHPVISHGPGASEQREVNPGLVRALERLSQPDRSRHPRDHDRRYRHGRPSHSHDRAHNTLRPTALSRQLRRPDLIRLLDRSGLLPAIVFIFSRTGCDQALRQCADARLSLTTPDERRQIRAVLHRRLAAIAPEDHDVLRLRQFRLSAEHGLAAHHAGMLPLLKETIEELFSAGLVKVVFATETLALGINMPARTVVLEKLSKFNGLTHADLTPGEYTQLTGRAGRRGLDTEGHAVVLAGPGTRAEDIAALASRRTYPLRSAFRPTPNMVVNLLETMTAKAARDLLEMSFAQFQADRQVVGLARRARELSRTVDAYKKAVTCDNGDFPAYDATCEAIGAREKELSRERDRRERKHREQTLRGLRRGDVMAIPAGRRGGFCVVIETGPQLDDMHGTRVRVVTEDGRVKLLGFKDLPSSPAVVDSLRVPAPDRLRQTRARKDLASALRERIKSKGSARDEAARLRHREPSRAAQDEQLNALRTSLREHPCHLCPERDSHRRWAVRYRKAKREHEDLVRKIDRRTSTIAQAFDALISLLMTLGYLREDTGRIVPTEYGHRLKRLFSERDVLIAECLRHGTWADLDPPLLAAMVSTTTFEARRDEGRIPVIPEDPRFERAFERTEELAKRLRFQEQRCGLEPTAMPDPGIALAVYRWAQGEGIADSLEGTDLSAGDFVRQCRQVIDLLEQLRDDPELGQTARRAVDMVRRGIVACTL
ncbi:DEAD/DEAH box helicase [Devriesea agamarum]|uniref:DEAD/DEAH box helicase n=1 Tax=Devriesea agamarum TaxID=472569 RepID=UPI000A039A2F|nr:DEAD/DEAH box helicase [Devriesea agamarum]